MNKIKYIIADEHNLTQLTANNLKDGLEYIFAPFGTQGQTFVSLTLHKKREPRETRDHFNTHVKNFMYDLNKGYYFLYEPKNKKKITKTVKTIIKNQKDLF